MDVQPQPSVLARALRWLGDMEQAMERRPEDDLAARIAELEKLLAVSAEAREGASPFKREG